MLTVVGITYQLQNLKDLGMEMPYSFLQFNLIVYLSIIDLQSLASM
jgi:hypothetical protein